MKDGHEWDAWHNEREQFSTRDSEGFTRDLAALEAHIKKLTKVCPKDKAGWPVQDALRHIAKLTKDYNRFKDYLSFNTR